MRLKPHLTIYAFALLTAGLTPAAAQVSASDIVLRLEALENQVRQLTGQVEQLQYRNQQLEQQLRVVGCGNIACEPACQGDALALVVHGERMVGGCDAGQSQGTHDTDCHGARDGGHGISHCNTPLRCFPV